MTIEYAHRIAEAAGLDIDLDCEGIDLQDKFYGLFQCFMPDGAVIEAVFVLMHADLCRRGAADAGGV